MRIYGGCRFVPYDTNPRIISYEPPMVVTAPLMVMPAALSSVAYRLSRTIVFLHLNSLLLFVVATFIY